LRRQVDAERAAVKCRREEKSAARGRIKIAVDSACRAAVYLRILWINITRASLAADFSATQRLRLKHMLELESWFCVRFFALRCFGRSFIFRFQRHDMHSPEADSSFENQNSQPLTQRHELYSWMSQAERSFHPGQTEEMPTVDRKRTVQHFEPLALDKLKGSPRLVPSQPSPLILSVIYRYNINHR
jgi:hypothetical protein